MHTPSRIHCLALALLLAAASAGTAAQQRDHNEIIKVPNQDRDMAAAIAKARATLDDFLAVWKAKPPGATEFRLKVGVKDGEQTEHFWVQPFRVAGTGFEGTLANEPRVVRNVRNGQQITFSRSEVSDWGYVLDGKQVGSFTICAMFKHAPKDQADYYRKNYGFEC